MVRGAAAGGDLTVIVSGIHGQGKIHLAKVVHALDAVCLGFRRRKGREQERGKNGDHTNGNQQFHQSETTLPSELLQCQNHVKSDQSYTKNTKPGQKLQLECSHS